MADFPNIDAVARDGYFALDYETTGLQYWMPDFRVFGAAIALPGGYSNYWDLRETPEARHFILDAIKNRRVIAQNAQFEVQCTRVLGGDPRQTDWWCTMVHECLINEHHLTYNLEAICQHWGIESQKYIILDQIATAMGWPGGAREVLSRLSEVPPAMVVAYGSSDARDALAIYEKQSREIVKQNLHLVSELEMQLLPVLADMSWGGIRVDTQAAQAAIPVLDQEADIVQKEINEIVGRPFNVNSTPQIREFFKPDPINKFQWRLIDGTLVGPTKSGRGPGLDQVALRTIKHPLAGKIVQLRKTIKLRDTFLRGHVLGNADEDGYVHTQFNQTRNDADAGTVTGRLSAVDPALQQITKRDKRNAEILRSLFLGDEGDDWFCTDYSQVDFRCSADLINDPSVIKAYWDDPSLDYHQIVSDMTGIPRNAPYAGAPYTKQINLGLAFGAGAGKLSFMMGMDYIIKEYKGKMAYVPGPEAKRIFDLYHAKLPGVQKFMKQAESVAKETHYVKTRLGRRLRFPRGMGAHKAAGLLYQAYAADLHKIGLVALDETIRKEKMDARLMMSCHDEAGISMKPDKEQAALLTAVYTDFNSEDSRVRMRVPITASGKFGKNWFDASKD